MQRFEEKLWSQLIESLYTYTCLHCAQLYILLMLQVYANYTDRHVSHMPQLFVHMCMPVKSRCITLIWSQGPPGRKPFGTKRSLDWRTSSASILTTLHANHFIWGILKPLAYVKQLTFCTRLLLKCVLCDYKWTNSAKRCKCTPESHWHLITQARFWSSKMQPNLPNTVHIQDYIFSRCQAAWSCSPTLSLDRFIRYANNQENSLVVQPGRGPIQFLSA